MSVSFLFQRERERETFRVKYELSLGGDDFNSFFSQCKGRYYYAVVAVVGNSIIRDFFECMCFECV